ncbi:MAG: M56 family metallopeptidase [Bacteroidia bacterium]|nr:M56 family metallopeptidase [Bacteroidia bacterium]
MISGLIICSVLPFVKLKLEKSYAFQQTIYQIEEILLPEKTVENEVKPKLQSNELIADINPELTITQTTSIEKNPKPISWFSILILGYWLGMGAMLLRLGISFLSLNRLFRKSRKVEFDDYRLIVSPESVAPFSFFRYIVLSEKDYRENPNEVILHEKMHILKKHNIDVIFSELFLAIHWFNPMAWMLCRDLREIHEYEADNAVINIGIEAQKYQLLLVKKAVGERRFTSVVNSFNQSKIKNRITMMLKKESPKWARLKVLFALPLVVVALLAFAQPEIMEDRIIDYQSRKNATDYFLSIRKEQKENYLAYLYMNTNDQLFLMHGNAEYVSMKAFDLKEKSDLTKIFTDLISKKIHETLAPVNFIIGAESDTKMRNVTLVKNAMSEAYNKSCVSISIERDVSSSKVKEEFPLTITYTSVQPGDPESIAKQVQSNPFFYWEQMRKYCDEKKIEPKNLKNEFVLTGVNRNLMVILINSVNAVMYQGLETNWFKTSDEALSEKSVETLKNMIVEMMEKNANGSIFFSLQHDVKSSASFVSNFINYALPSAYENALKDISAHENIPLNQLKENRPLLLTYAVPIVYSAGGKSPTKQVEDKPDTFTLRTSSQQDDVESMSYYSIILKNFGNNTQTVEVRKEVLSGKFGNEIIKQETVSWSELEPINTVLVGVGYNLPKIELENFKTKLLDVKFKPKESYFILSL